MKYLAISIAFIVAVLLLIKMTDESELDQELSRWTTEGWIIYEKLGEEQASFLSVSHFKSDTANTLKATWITNGERSDKVYEQKSRRFLILVFSKDPNNSFVIVLQKQREPMSMKPKGIKASTMTPTAGDAGVASPKQERK